ncbi:hypothetical protein HOLleu_28940 [Holothuria leucospilota]|uniref:Uncharacterized protein n=1 Tax=Holothuria leucospilota TaxID=206669 RepID=A0A9Q1BMR1_HOLLE|nr:hypothetical protein HOLleu_28940 [Holothuria leucospilota]
MAPMKQWLVCVVAYCVMYEGSAQMEFSPTCGLPQPIREQEEELNQIQPALMEAIRNRLQDGPILLNVQDPLAIPLVTFTDNQTALLDDLYGDNPSDQVSLIRRKRGTPSFPDRTACRGSSGFRPVLMALSDRGEIIQLNGVRLQVATSCVPTPFVQQACSNCCLATICVPVVGFNIDTVSVASANVMVNRCTCCSLTPP